MSAAELDQCPDVETALRRADVALRAGWVRDDQAEVVLAAEVRRLRGRLSTVTRAYCRAVQRIEHKRRRARLKRQHEGEETKTERCYERWDKWSWD